jgi:hypothetical protein
VPAERPVPSARGRRAVDVCPRVARGALPDCSGTVGAVEERLVPDTAPGPVVLSYEEVWFTEHPAAAHEDVGMLIEVMTKAYSPPFIAPITTKVGRVIASSPQSRSSERRQIQRRYTFSARQTPGREKIFISPKIGSRHALEIGHRRVRRIPGDHVMGL